MIQFLPMLTRVGITLRNAAPIIIAVGRRLLTVAGIAAAFGAVSGAVGGFISRLIGREPTPTELPSTMEEVEAIFDAIQKNGRVDADELPLLQDLNAVKEDLKRTGPVAGSDRARMIIAIERFLQWARSAPTGKNVNVPDLSDTGGEDLIELARRRAVATLRPLPLSRLTPIATPLGTAAFARDFGPVEVVNLKDAIELTLAKRSALTYEEGCLLLTGIYSKLVAAISDHVEENAHLAFTDANREITTEQLWDSFLYG